jgi:NADH dehydrogenase
VKILVTGATGYIGSVFVRRALASGHAIMAASRRRAQAGEWVPYQLGDALALPGDVDVIVHMAADTTGAVNDPEAELRAVVALMEAPSAAGIPFVFVSSQTARADAPTAYGRTKWIIEQRVLARGGWVVRPGQVYGGPELGLFGTLTSLLRRLPVLPALVPGPLIQPIHVEDCAEGLLRVALRQPAGLHVIHLAAAEPVTFTHFLRRIARDRVRRRVFFIPFPSALLRGVSRGIRGIRRSGVSLPLLDKLDSLLEVPCVSSAGDMSALALTLRSLDDGMLKAGGGRRRLLEEGRALIGYVLRSPPSGQLLTRYVRSVELLRHGRALGLPGWMAVAPALVAAIDSPAILRNHEELRWRIDAATAISEASPAGFRRYMRAGLRQAKPIAVIRLACAVVSEVAWRVARPIVSRALLRRIRSLESPRV